MSKLQELAAINGYGRLHQHLGTDVRVKPKVDLSMVHPSGTRELYNSELVTILSWEGEHKRASAVSWVVRTQDGHIFFVPGSKLRLL